MQAQTTTTLAITSGGSSVTTVSAGAVVTLTATVLQGSTPVTPGLVTFCDATAAYCEDVHIVGAAQLTTAGTAVFKFRPGAGSHSYKAVFAGTSSYAASTSAASSLTVGPLHPTTTTLQGYVGSSPTQPLPYELTATVAGLSASSPGQTGQVSFLDASNNNALIGSATLGSPSYAINLSVSSGPATGKYPNGIAIADFNGDGIPDIAIPNGLSNNVTVLLGNGDGTFTAAPSPATGNSPYAIVTADFNGDGIPDLAVADALSDEITILLGKGNGTFSAVSSSPATGNSPTSLAVADFNGDGIPDLAVTNDSDQTITILLGNGDGTFTATANPVSLPAQFDPNQIVAADFNGDGVPDLAVLGFGTSVLIFQGKGDGTFTEVDSGITVPGDSPAIVEADFNGDGIPDLAIAGGSSTLIWLGEGNGSFTAGPTPNGTGSVVGLAVADFNSDGIPDLVEVTETDPVATLYLGNGDGTFSANTSIALNPSGIEGEFAAAGDLNGDGFPDLVATGYWGANVNLTSNASVVLVKPQYTSTASGSFPALVNTHNIEASYPGDSNYAASLSSPLSLTYQIQANLTISVSPSSGLAAGQTALFTATLSPYSFEGYTTNGEPVAFVYPDVIDLGTSPLSNGVATFTSPPLSAGSYTVDASYLSDGNFQQEGSNVVAFTVAQAQPTLTLSASPSGGSTQGQSVTLNALLSGDGPFTGESVVFFSNGQRIGAGTISSGSASLTLTTLSPAINALTAAYAGDSNNLSATSNALQYPVKRAGQAPSTVSLAISGGASVALDTTVTLTATVTTSGSPAAPGTVVFCDATISATCAGLAELGTAQLTAAGTTSLAVRLGFGSHSLVASFQGTNSLEPGISSQVPLTVTGQFATTTTLSARNSGSTVDLSSTVSATAPQSAGPVTGNFEIEDQSDGNLGVLYGPLSGSSFVSPLFSAVVSPATGTTPFSIAAADLNHDGIPDMVVANSGDNDVGVRLGNGDGTFQAQVTYGAGNGPFAAAIGDFNDDGYPDIAVTNFTDGTVSILLGNGDGTFKAQTAYGVGNGPAAIVLGDFNGDGILDLAVANEKDNTISILLGNGDGTFQTQQTFSSGHSPDALAAGYFTNDGFLDLAVANNADGTVGILLGNGNGAFQTMTPYTVGTNPVSIAVTDYNADGLPDLAVANLSSNNFSVLFGNADGSFQAQKTYSTGANSGPEAIIAGSFAATGNADLAVANSAANTVAIFVNNGSGVFSASTAGPYSTGAGPLALAAADWNSDGLLDLATVNNSAGTSTVLLNASGPAVVVTTSSQLPGNNTLLAVYSGSTIFNPSTSAQVQTGQAKAATTLTLSNPGSPNPSDYGQSATLIATLSPYTESGISTNGESVSFMSDNVVIGTGTLAAGVASLQLSTLPVGADAITASYAGDNYFQASTASGFTQTVRPSTLIVTASNATRAYGASNPTFTGSVSGAVNGDTFTVSGSTTATAGSAPGGYPITPVASGAHLSDYTVSAVNGTLTVTQATPAIALGASASEIYTSSSVTFTATLTASGSGAAPTGSVSFYDGSNPLGSGTVSSGIATYSTSSLSAGTHSITAVYGGDANYAIATSSAISEDVVAATFTVQPPSGGTFTQTATPGSQAVYTLTFTPINATFPNTVTFSVMGLPAGATATFNPASIPAGASATNVTLTITLPASAAVVPLQKPLRGAPIPISLATILLGLAGLRKASRRNLGLRMMVFAAAVALAAVSIGCTGNGTSGSSGTSSQTPQSYTLTVTATSGGASLNTQIQLTVE